MKKMILVPIFMILILGIGMARLSEPMPISVIVTDQGFPIVADITITNLRTGESMTLQTAEEDGGITFEWANTVLGFTLGDEFKIDLCGKTRTVRYTGYAIEIQRFDITDASCPVIEPPVCPEDTTPFEKCDSCCAECPVQPTCYEQGYILPSDCPANVCPICEDCKQVTDESLVLILIALAGGAGTAYAYGVKAYKSPTGKASVKHLHKGIVGYHDINTVHNNIKIRHKKGEVAPKYNADGAYVG